MSERFKVGHHAPWNSEAGHLSCRIIKVHAGDLDYNGYTHHPSADEPRYEIRSDKSENFAAHKGTALQKIIEASLPGVARRMRLHHAITAGDMLMLRYARAR